MLQYSIVSRVTGPTHVGSCAAAMALTPWMQQAQGGVTKGSGTDPTTSKKLLDQIEGLDMILVR